MRAISPIGSYGIQLVEQRVKRGLDKTGAVVEFYDGELVHAQFHKGGLTEWEELAALERFDFSGLPEGINPLTRVSMFDSEAYCAKYTNPNEYAARLAEIDERLEYLSKLFPNEFILVAKPAAPKPWPTYDVTPVEDVEDEFGNVEQQGIFTMQGITGISPQEIRLYEVEHENRPEVIEAMEALEEAQAGLVPGGAPAFSVSV